MCLRKKQTAAMSKNEVLYRRALLSITAVVEAATGLALLLAPSLLVEALLGAPPDMPVGVTVSRVAGGALLALGFACWNARSDATANGLVASMLLYNVSTIAVLLLAGTRHMIAGTAFWPVIVAHAVLAAWCLACLVVRSPRADAPPR